MKRNGNWTADARVERAALRRDYLEHTPAQRAEQVFELSRFMAQVAEAGRRRVALKELAGRPEDLTDLERLKQARDE